MSYRSFATLAAAFAALMIVSAPASVAAAKSEPESKHANATPSKAPELYAQAGGFNGEARLVRLDAQAISSAAEVQPAKSSDEAPLNLMALVIAGFAVMGSLAFRRSPNK